MFGLKDKVAIVTGSSKGIGRSIAQAMSASGAKVVISSRNIDSCNIASAGINESGGESIAVPCNVSRKEDLQNLVDTTIDKWGRVDILVCNAAANPYYGPMAKMSDDAYDKVMGTNVKSNFWLCNMVAPKIAEQPSGSIIIVSSIGGLLGSDTLGVYGMSKAADFSLVRSLAVEWGPSGITANCIAPGLIKTDFSKALWENPRIGEGIAQGTPVRRIGDAEDISGVAVFMASDSARYLTGQTIVVDGGATIKEPV